MTTRWSKDGKHPDLDDDGQLKLDVQYFGHEGWAALDHNRRMADPTEHQAFMQQVAREQAQLPVGVQQMVQGQTFAPQGSPAQGYAEYLRAIESAKQADARARGFTRQVLDGDLPTMTTAEADEVLDERGQPRSGVDFHYTSRSQIIDDRTNSRQAR